MKRTIIKIDEDLCNGCGNCIPNCHEGALQIIDGKARLISDLFCDGLGACIGHCPEGAISLEEREAEPYDEIKVMEQMVVPKGRNTILAHLEHLRDHNETELLKQAIGYIKDNNIDMSPKNGEDNFKPARQQVASFASIEQARAAVAVPVSSGCGGGCPGSKPIDFNIDLSKVDEAVNQAKNEAAQTAGEDAPSELRQWPVQLHLLNPQAGYFKNADVLLAADCVAFAMGNFHNKYLKGKTLAIACPKLDSNKESYIEKLTSMITNSNINTLSVLMMEVPCCGGLIQMATMARQMSGKNIPIKKTIVGLQGQLLSEEWM
ncbi:MAG: 4Fe-4S binding protein [Lentimicrobiaceae bacterium]|jgi:ferredoxin|nr:4Fe-4S binding protein [Lentimicrobiaceae bacterium]MDD4598724.1 4Fe-4S binding protein [Lentimicrobiaceae bacterium]MDY0026464.1 4Fe-4S binding protein [Lentimicrobium sp.]